MASRMASQGLTYYSAIALHDLRCLVPERRRLLDALDLGVQALRQFSKLPYFAVEQLSTHTVMAICEAELGNTTSSEAHEDAALVHGTEFADVPAVLAFLATLVGDSDKASRLASRARLQQHRNRSDAVGDALLEHALAASELRTNLASATTRLDKTIFDFPLELGYSLEREALLSQALLLGGDTSSAERLRASL